jgi:hypothetical protein
MAEYSITDLVRNVQKKAPLPANFNDLDEQTKRRLQREADKQDTTPEKLYAAIRAQAEHEANDDFDPGAIAAAARR